MIFVTYNRFLFESLKVTTLSSSRFNRIDRCSYLLQYFNKKWNAIKGFLFFSCAIHSFLIWVSESSWVVFFNIWPGTWLVKNVEILQQNEKAEMIKRFLMFLVPCIHFLFESLKGSELFSSRFDQIHGWSNMLKYYNKIKRQR